MTLKSMLSSADFDHGLSKLLHQAKGLESIFSETDGTDMYQQIYATQNFLTTLSGTHENDIVEGFLRIARWGVLLEDGAIVVLSDREADGALASFWKHVKSSDTGKQQSSTKNTIFSIRTTTWDPVKPVHHEAVVKEGKHIGERERRAVPALHLGSQLTFTDWSQVVFAIYNGKTNFPNVPHRKLLKHILHKDRARTALPAFIQPRDHFLSWARSDVDRECRKYEALLLHDCTP